MTDMWVDSLYEAFVETALKDTNSESELGVILSGNDHAGARDR